ncbi:XK-related protein 5b isoform X1 [Alosa sapidissima]|uniref:XK-related protein 5b isoform X1 n=1 Tax=Alosa sapidissima TaxID=34773 RepID=UPI001C08C103|nr:XK-related protein 5b isoform X1 [Alosa sapidissima]
MQCERGIWAMWCQICLFLVTAVISLSERTTLFFCVVYFFLIGRTLWACLSLGLIVLGSVAQVLSFRWCMSDGKKGRMSMILIHVLHMGIFTRLLKCMRTLWRQQDKDVGVGNVVMQQADVSALGLLEALLVSLPQTLLHTYILFSSDQGLSSPVSLACGLCLLSLCWALVLYGRACSLLRPGHVPMPPAAIVCQLVWRVSMLGARVTSLVFFTRVFTWWVCGIAGFHWLVASFWLVSQQTDIFRSPGRWRLFNCILGALHVFFFLNVKDGPCRFRMAAFYVVMLLENFALLLSASDILAEASWANLCIPTAVLCSFLIGVISVTVYYRFLHPKSTEILQSLHRSQAAQASLEQGSFTGEKTAPEPSVHRHGTFSITGYAQTLGQSEHSELSTNKHSMTPKHHHWWLICLAVKTGDWNKVNLVYGPEGLAALLDVNGGPRCLDDEPPDLEAAPKHDNEEQLSEKRESQYFTVSTSVRQSQPSEDHKEAIENDPDNSGSIENDPDNFGSGTKRECPEGRSGLEDSVETDCDVDDSDTTLYFSADPTSPHCVTNVPAVAKDTHLEAIAQLSPVPNREPLQWGTKELLSREPCFTSTPKHDLKAKENIGPRPLGFRRQVQFK